MTLTHKLMENEFQKRVDAAEQRADVAEKRADTAEQNAARLQLLTKKMLELNKIDELRTAIEDEDYREILYQKYSI